MSRKIFTVGAIIVCLFFTALISRNGTLALMALPFLTYMGIGILGSPRPEKIELTAERSLETRRSNGVSSVEVRVTVRNAGAEVGPLFLSDSLQPAMTVTEGSLRQLAVLETGEETVLKYAFTAARGGFQWQTLHAVTSDQFGLFESGIELPAAAEILVQPMVKKFRPFTLRPESTLHSPGLIPARIGGSGTDFWGVREYHPGDPLRRLDWRRTARHPRRIFTKELEQEEITDIGMILDARQTAEFLCGDESLLEYVLDAAMSLAEMFLRGGNRLSLLVVGEGMPMVYPGYGKAQLQRILRVLAKVRPGANSSRVSLSHAPLHLFASRALIVIISPQTTYDSAIFPRFWTHGNQALLISPDPIDFTQSEFARDRAGRLAVRVARLERRVELDDIVRHGIRVIDWQVHRQLSPLVRNALRASRGRRP